jgi:hypothetical protein
LITQSDDGQDFDPDDPLTVILRPIPDDLGLPPGRYEKIRRGAARRRLLRIAVGVGLSGAVAALVALPLHLPVPDSPASPAVPLGPPPASSPSTGPTSSPPAAPAVTRPTKPVTPRATVTPAVPTADVLPATPTPTIGASSQSGEPPSARPTSLNR